MTGRSYSERKDRDQNDWKCHPPFHRAIIIQARRKSSSRTSQKIFERFAFSLVAVRVAAPFQLQERKVTAETFRNQHRSSLSSFMTKSAISTSCVVLRTSNLYCAASTRALDHRHFSRYNTVAGSSDGFRPKSLRTKLASR
jgi:hypothetical protein